MLLLDSSNNEQLSLSFRLRGSWFLEDLYEKRIELYQDLKEIYKCRSQVAHSGMLYSGNAKKNRKAEDCFPRYQRIAERICHKIILEGNPVWDELILGKRQE
jgi:hypothetical protein